MIRKYALELYDDGANVTGSHQWVAFLDLDDGPQLASAGAELDRLLANLARQEGARERDMHRYYLAVLHWHSRERVCHWPNRHDTERGEDLACCH